MSIPNNVQYAVQIGSKTLDADYPIQSIVVERKINKIPYAKIVLYDGSIQSRTFAIANKDKKVFSIGATVTIEAGYDNNLSQIFKGVIAKLAVQSRLTTESTFTITCRDVAYKTTIAPKSKHFEKCTDSDVFKKILGTYSGLSMKCSATSIIHECLTQYEVSDWDFLNIRAEANGQIVVVEDGTIVIKPPKTTGNSICTYTYGVDIIDFKAEIDAKDQWAAATAYSWDSQQQRMVKEKADDPGEKSIGEISYKSLTSATGHGIGTVAHGGIGDPVELKTLATGLLNRRRIAKMKGSITVNGNANLLNDHLVTISNGAVAFSGNAYISGVYHCLSDGIWETTLTLGLDSMRYMRQYNDIVALPAAGMMPPIYGLQLGIVKKITEDPQKNNRVLVHLPLMQDQPKEGTWCRLASCYATQQAGIFVVPELEDEVVVGFINDDIRFPIILGSLYSSKHLPPKTIEGKNMFKSFVSREKLEVTFHDDKEGPAILIKTPMGGLIQLSDKDKHIEIVDHNGNKVVLSQDGIGLTSSKNIVLNAQANITIKSGQDVVIEGGQNIQLKSMNINAQASMKASLSGNSSTEVKSGMTTIIKGTTVLIN